MLHYIPIIRAFVLHWYASVMLDHLFSNTSHYYYAYILIHNYFQWAPQLYTSADVGPTAVHISKECYVCLPIIVLLLL